jgi:hypothetical protein
MDLENVFFDKLDVSPDIAKLLPALVVAVSLGVACTLTFARLFSAYLMPAGADGGAADVAALQAEASRQAATIDRMSRRIGELEGIAASGVSPSRMTATSPGASSPTMYRAVPSPTSALRYSSPNR